MISLHSILLLLFFLTMASSGCTVCNGFGAAAGCTGDATTCPFITTVAANVLNLAKGTALVGTILLPLKIRRIFSTQVLATLSALSRKLHSAGEYDYDGKDFATIKADVISGAASKQGAIGHLAEQVSELSEELDLQQYTRKKDSLEFQIKVIENLKASATDIKESLEGSYLFVLYKLSGIFSVGRQSVTSMSAGTCEPCDDTGSSSKGRSFSALLVRPKSQAHMYSLLNAFIATTHVLGQFNVLATTMFLEDVVYEPVRNGELHWAVAFECVIIYLRMLEAQGDIDLGFSLSDIHLRAGGIDAIRKEATDTAHCIYPAAFFRAHGGTPLHDRLDDSKHNDGVYEGTITGDTPTSKRGCTAWNSGKPHLKKHVGPDGKCVFKHACCQFVTDKGPNGQCLGTVGDAKHKRANCPYDQDKKSKQAVRA